MLYIEDLEQQSRKSYENGIVLSGDGAKGFAHIGVLKALNEKGIYPDVISGTSAGSIVASLYADGIDPDDIIKIFKGKDLYVDGGMFANLPVEPLIGKCERIIGVHVNPFGLYDIRDESLTSIAERVFQIGTRSNVLDDVSECDWYIEPPKLKDYGLLSVKKGQEMFEIGYEYTLAFLEKKGF